MKKVDYYQTGAGREVIDEIEDNLGALGTAFFCSANVIKYKYRKGKKAVFVTLCIPKLSNSPISRSENILICF